MVLHLLTVGAAALLTPPRPGFGCRACRHSEVRMGMFDGLAAAFANDDSLGEKKGVATKTMRTITWRDPKGEVKSSQAIPGQKLKDIARQDGIGPIKYSCNEVRARLSSPAPLTLSSPSTEPLSPALSRAPQPQSRPEPQLQPQLQPQPQPQPRPRRAHTRRAPLQGTCKSCDMLCNGDRLPACVARMVRSRPIGVEPTLESRAHPRRACSESCAADHCSSPDHCSSQRTRATASDAPFFTWAALQRLHAPATRLHLTCIRIC